MNRINNFFNSYTLPVLVGVTLGLLSGGVTLLDKFIHLQSDVEILKRDIKSIKGEDLPEIKEELRILHGLFHSVSIGVKSKISLQNNEKVNKNIFDKLAGPSLVKVKKRSAEPRKVSKIAFSKWFPDLFKIEYLAQNYRTQHVLNMCIFNKRGV